MVDIPRPPGYENAVPFDKERHKRLGIPRDSAKFSRCLNAIYITAAEFAYACHDYPIAFAKEAGGALIPVIVTGLNSGTNLFVNDTGVWIPGTYCPGYVRRYPFFTATLANSAESKAIICFDPSGLVANAPALMNVAGEPTARWREVELLIREMDDAQRTTAAFCKQLQLLGLLEPFHADFHPRGGPQVTVAGLWRITEHRLKALDSIALRSLMQVAYLKLVYAHLLSLENFNRLLDRHVEQSS